MNNQPNQTAVKEITPSRSYIIRKTARTFSSYIGCIAISLFVTFFLNGTVGILLTAALIIAFVLSLLVTLAVRPSVVLSAELDKTAASKGESVLYTMTLSKRTIIPAPIIELYPGCSAHLIKETDVCRISLAGNEANMMTVPLRVVHSGAARVFLRGAYICDFLGIFRFRLCADINELASEIAVYPDIPDVPVQTGFIKRAVMSSGHDDDEEETNETASGQTGMPGYDHREYYPGDPIKRINWKLSSKRDIYMIRLDERIAGSGQFFFLDCPEIPEGNYTLTVRDCVTEGLLAVLSMIVRDGKEAVCFLPENGEWRRAEIRQASDVEILQEQLSGLTPTGTASVIPPEILTSGKSPICFTCALSGASGSAEQIISLVPETLIVCAESSLLPQITNEIWRISPDFEIAKK